MSSRSRYTSPLHAGARFVAQRGICSNRRSGGWSPSPCSAGSTSTAVRGPFVVVSNHTSHLDAPLIIGALPRKLSRYVAAGAAADYFFDVWWRKGLTSLFFNAFPVDRTGLRGRHGLATSLLDDGVPLLLFPEGTRSRTGEMGSFKPGAAALCISRDVPCLPVAIVGAARGHAVRQELARPRPAAGLCHLRRADARRGRRDGRPVLRSASPKRSRGLIDYTTTIGRRPAPRDDRAH